MATSTAQRVGIWVIAVAMIVGTVVGFIVMILSSQNDANSQSALAKYQAEYSDYTTKSGKQQKDVDARTSDLSNTYKSVFLPLKDRVTTFDAASVKELSTAEITAGNGVAITDDTTYLAYYIGYTPDGAIFDSSLDADKLKAPLIVRPNGVISGWSKALKGQKIGGMYELTIPSDLAYGATGSGEKIKPNTPLKFVVMPIETTTTYKEPALTQEVIKAYGSSN